MNCWPASGNLATYFLRGPVLVVEDFCQLKCWDNVNLLLNLLVTFWEVFASTNIAVLFIVYGLSNLCRWYHCFKEKNLPVNVCVKGANCHLYRWCLMTNILLFSTGPLECEHLLHLPVGARFEPIFVNDIFCSITPVSSCE